MAIAAQQKTRVSGYKDTEAGVIPENWIAQMLSSFVRHHNAGIYKKRELYGSGTNIIGVSELYGIQSVDGQVFALVPLSEKERDKYTLEAGDLLYGESSLVREGIARTVYVTERGAGTAFAWHTRRYSIDQNTLLPGYVSYYLQTRPARKHMMDQSIQTAITGINTVAYFACPITVPPISEQRVIVGALSDVDRLIASLDKLIAKKRSLKQAAMQQLLTRKCRLPGFSVEWETAAIKDIANYVASGKSSVTPTNGTYPVYGSTGVIGYNEVSDYSGDAILVARVGENAGKLNLVTGKYGVTDNTIILRLSSAQCLAFFWYQLQMMRLNSLVFGSGQPLITGTLLKKLTVHVPLLPEQTAIAAVLSDMDAEIAILERRRDKTRALKHGMMQELLTGRTRLI